MGYYTPYWNIRKEACEGLTADIGYFPWSQLAATPHIYMCW